MIRLFTIITAIMLFSAGNAGASEVLHSIKHDDYDRNYTVYKPESIKEGDLAPVVMVFHGGGGNSKSTMRQTSMNKTADKHGFLVVYPEGVGTKFHTWNAGNCCGSAHKNDVDDVGYVSALLDKLSEDYFVDEQRIYATGLSNGAMMSYRLSCELSDRITAIAPVAAQNTMEECSSERAVPTIHFHGTKDECALYEGGEECGGCFADFFRGVGIPMPRKTWSCEPVEQTLEDRAKEFLCEPEAKVVFQKNEVTCVRWDGCTDQADVELCTIKGGGHSWPGGEVAPDFCHKKPDGWLCERWKKRIGHITEEIDANEAMWAFFSRYSL